MQSLVGLWRERDWMKRALYSCATATSKSCWASFSSFSGSRIEFPTRLSLCPGSRRGLAGGGATRSCSPYPGIYLQRSLNCCTTRAKVQKASLHPQQRKPFVNLRATYARTGVCSTFSGRVTVSKTVEYLAITTTTTLKNRLGIVSTVTAANQNLKLRHCTVIAHCVLSKVHPWQMRSVSTPRGGSSGLIPPNKAPSPPNWNVKHYRSVELLSIFTMSSTPEKTQSRPDENFLATVLDGIHYKTAFNVRRAEPSQWKQPDNHFPALYFVCVLSARATNNN